MKAALISLALLLVQMNSLQDKPVAHLPVHASVIDTQFGGKLLELINAPAQLLLPAIPPKVDSQGAPWSVDVKNLGPSAVTITGKAQFSVRISVGQTIHIFSNGTIYTLKH